MHRGNMRIPEHQLNKMRKTKDKKAVHSSLGAEFFIDDYKYMKVLKNQ